MLSSKSLEPLARWLAAIEARVTPLVARLPFHLGDDETDGWLSLAAVVVFVVVVVGAVAVALRCGRVRPWLTSAPMHSARASSQPNVKARNRCIGSAAKTLATERPRARLLALPASSLASIVSHFDSARGSRARGLEHCRRNRRRMLGDLGGAACRARRQCISRAPNSSGRERSTGPRGSTSCARLERKLRHQADSSSSAADNDKYD